MNKNKKNHEILEVKYHPHLVAELQTSCQLLFSTITWFLIN